MTLHPDEALLAALEPYRSQKAVVMCPTRASAERTAAMLERNGFRSAAYHAGFEPDKRAAIQKAFTEDRTNVLAATVAFGMGIDVPDIRCIVHLALPASVSDYMQETGRAGRDGAPSDCILLVNPASMRMRRAHAAASGKKRSRNPFRDRERHQDRKRQKTAAEVFFSGRCIPAGLSAAMGQHIRPCGTCSACLRRADGKKGRIAPRISPAAVSGNELNLWWARVIRARLAAGRGVPEMKVMRWTALYQAVRRHHLGKESVPDDELRGQLLLLLQPQSTAREETQPS